MQAAASVTGTTTKMAMRKLITMARRVMTVARLDIGVLARSDV